MIRVDGISHGNHWDLLQALGESNRKLFHLLAACGAIDQLSVIEPPTMGA
jgi:hypothetical protein